MRRLVLVVAAVVMLAGVGVLAADVFQTYGLDRQGWSDSFMAALTARWFSPFEVPAKLKALQPAERVTLVNALGAMARAWVETPEFKAAYKKKYEDSLPDDLKPPRAAAQIADELRANNKKGLAEMEEAMKSMPPDMRKQAEAGMNQMRAQIKEQEAQIDAAAAQMAQEEKARYEEARSRPPDPDATPALRCPGSPVRAAQESGRAVGLTNRLRAQSDGKPAESRLEIPDAGARAGDAKMPGNLL